MNKGFIWQARPWQAFKNVAIIFSFIINLIFVVVILLILPLLLPGISGIARPLVSGLSNSFVQMGDAAIVRTISVDDRIPVIFELPLSQETQVVLIRPVPMTVPATFVLPAGGGTINGTVLLELPSGTTLPIALDMTVPVSTTIPVRLDVGVNIPMQETELAAPFNTLRALFLPLDQFLGGLPASNEDLYQRLNTAARDQEEQAASPSASPSAVLEPIGERAP